MKIKRIEFLGIDKVYNMEVENHHNFSVNGGFIVHNCDALRGFVAGRPLAAAKAAEVEREEEGGGMRGFLDYGV